MNELSKDSASWLEVDADSAGQRIDNYLMRLLKGVPKSHVYRILRSGQVRVNSGRIGPEYRLEAGDRVRVPPVRVAQRSGGAAPARGFEGAILYEDDALLILDKPAGVAVHGGSGVSFGVVEQLRAARPDARFLELVHRLDRDTSGVLMLAKKRAALTTLHRQLRDGEVAKHYAVLVRGQWRNQRQNVRLALSKYVLASGERRVSVNRDGMASHTLFTLRRAFSGHSLLEAELKTGRTHQIRVHLAHLGFPIAGDDKYGDFAWNKALARQGLKRMFLHSAKLAFAHPVSGEQLTVEAALPRELSGFLESLEEAHAAGPA